MHETLLLFGATGDLAQRYLFPSLADLLRDRQLPRDFRVIAVARQSNTSESFRQWIDEGLIEKSGMDTTSSALIDLLRRTNYIMVDLSNPSTLAAPLTAVTSRDWLSYLATPPSLYVPICEGRKAASLLQSTAFLRGIALLKERNQRNRGIRE
jgi:glucose-6-phosphate 1-dehydrogenase